MMSADDIQRTIDACLYGTRAPNGTHDLPDWAWLMGWADWQIEQQMIAEEAEQRRG